MVILTTITFSNLDNNIEILGSECTTEIDVDVGGDGVRDAVYVPVGMLLLVSILGTFHYRGTGVKELGAGLLLTEFSLNIALQRFQR